MNKTSERRDGPTPNGGAYSIAYYRDASGKPATKDKAVEIEIVEYAADGREVVRTYAVINARCLTNNFI